MTTIGILGIDIAKNTFQLHGAAAGYSIDSPNTHSNGQESNSADQ
jgi:hypothetical protein